jgi:hypothetical protein
VRPKVRFITCGAGRDKSVPRGVRGRRTTRGLEHPSWAVSGDRNSISTDDPDEIESTGLAHRNELAAAADEKTLRRARWEYLRLAACPGTGCVNVCNLSYGVREKADHTYTVTVERDPLIAPVPPPRTRAAPASTLWPSPPIEKSSTNFEARNEPTSATNSER